MGAPDARRRLGSVALAVGCLSLAIAVLVAHAHPAGGYEVSIYRATPWPFWAGIGLTWLLVTPIAVGTASRGRRWAATAIGGGAAVALVGLPLVRGYYFFASGDSLSHLGWVRDLGAGRLTPIDLFYPGMHSVSVLVSQTLGVGYPRAIMLAVLMVAIGFFTAVPAAVWALTGSDRAAVVGAFSAFMLLPINIVVTQLVIHPITEASLFLAVLVYLLVRYLTSPARGSWRSPTALGMVLALSSAGLLLYHPQAVMSLLVMLAAVAIAQFVARRRWPESSVASLRPVYAQTGFLALVFVGWLALPQHQGYAHLFRVAARTFVAFVTGQPTPVAAEVAQRGASLSAIGASLLEVFLKLFLVSTVFVLLAGLLFWWCLAGRRSGLGDATRGVVDLFVVGLFALAGFMAVQFLGTFSGLVYRYVSIGMTVVTILGAVALYHLILRDEATVDRPWSVRTTVLTLALVVMLGLSVPVAFASPYVYQASSDVSRMQLDGYRSAFDVVEPNATVVNIRGGVWRFRHAVEGTVGHPWRGETLPGSAIEAGLVGNRSSARYVVVTRAAYDREVDVYRQLRYTVGDFRRLATEPGVDRVQSNGGFDLYYVPGTGGRR